MRIRDLLDEVVIKVGLESLDKEECFEELVDVLVRSGKISDRDSALAAVLRREEQGSTGIGLGVAIPHGKDASFSTLTAALGISEDGIEFDAVDGDPVHFVFMLLARSDEPGPHIQALAEISRLLRVPGFYRKVVEAGSARQIMELLESEE